MLKFNYLRAEGRRAGRGDHGLHPIKQSCSAYTSVSLTYQLFGYNFPKLVTASFYSFVVAPPINLPGVDISEAGK
jgi:hypothetical protein